MSNQGQPGGQERAQSSSGTGTGYAPGYGGQAGGYGQGGYGQPAGYGAGYGGPQSYAQPTPPRLGGQKPRRSRRTAVRFLAAGVALAGAGAGVAVWAIGGTGTSAGGAAVSKRLSTASIVQMTDPDVVDIVSALGGQGEEAAGTGIVLTSSGIVLTNNHVVDGATSVKVTDLGNGRTYTATVTGYDPTHDVAVLKLSGASGLRTASIGNSDSVGVGQKVVAVGNAGGRGGLPSVATGQVTGLGAAITAVDEGSGSSEHLAGMIKTNAGIKPGDSGGPLLSASGRVVGMNTAASTAMIGAKSVTEQAFSIPINRAIATADKIEAGDGSSTVHVGPTAFLGVEIASQQNGGAGAPVQAVVADTPAASAGIEAGDKIVSIDGMAVTSSTSVRNDLVAYHPGNRVTVTWQDQNGQSESAAVTLGAGPAA